MIIKLKKIPEVIEEQKEKFIQGSINNGYEKEFAEDTFELIEYFSGYVFNKSHACSYAKLSYATAYLKNYFPVEFYASIMSFESDKTPKESKLQDYMSDCYQKNIDILPPDINESNEGFTAIKSKIRFGLQGIKGVGGKALEDLMKNRPFDDFIEFYDRVNKRLVNKTAVEALIKAGAFDSFDKDRNELMFLYHELRNNDFVKPRLFKMYEDASKKDFIKMELETLNMSITYPSRWDMVKPDNNVRLEGELLEVNKIQTKHGNDMAFGQLKTDKNIVKLVVFPDQYLKFKNVLKRGDKIVVGGKKSKDNSMIVKVIRRG